MMNPLSLLDRADYFWLFGIICVVAIGLTAVSISLYHRDGGSKSTKQIVMEGVVGYFAPLIFIYTLARKLFNRKS